MSESTTPLGFERTFVYPRFAISNAILANWAGIELTKPDDSEAMVEAKKYLQWAEDGIPKPLRLLFDSVHLSYCELNKKHYWQPDSINGKDPIIPYPQLQQPTARDLEELQKQIKELVIYGWM